MPRNLREKIRTTIGDAYDLRSEAVISKIERLVQDELQLQYEERQITFQDVMYVQSEAAKEYTSMRHDRDSLGSIADEPPAIRVLCTVMATVSLLRQKGLLTSTVRYKK